MREHAGAAQGGGTRRNAAHRECEPNMPRWRRGCSSKSVANAPLSLLNSERPRVRVIQETTTGIDQRAGIVIQITREQPSGALQNCKT
jgi:hypothetical protein